MRTRDVRYDEGVTRCFEVNTRVSVVYIVISRVVRLSFVLVYIFFLNSNTGFGESS